jgi:hypothetical protein
MEYTPVDTIRSKSSPSVDGEFASTSQTYAGTGTLRYSW